jgi:hypothetical protein
MAAALPLIIASTATAAVGAIYSGQQQRKGATMAAEQATVNAQAARQAAGAREETVRRQNAMRLGEQRAGAAQSGFDSSAGSFGELQGQSAGNAELDALSTRYEGELQALNLENEATSYRMRAKTATRQGYLNAAGSLMQGASMAYGAGLRMPTQSISPYSI